MGQTCNFKGVIFLGCVWLLFLNTKICGTCWKEVIIMKITYDLSSNQNWHWVETLPMAVL